MSLLPVQCADKVGHATYAGRRRAMRCPHFSISHGGGQSVRRHRKYVQRQIDATAETGQRSRSAHATAVSSTVDCDLLVARVSPGTPQGTGWRSGRGGDLLPASHSRSLVYVDIGPLTGKERLKWLVALPEDLRCAHRLSATCRLGVNARARWFCCHAAFKSPLPSCRAWPLRPQSLFDRGASRARLVS